MGSFDRALLAAISGGNRQVVAAGQTDATIGHAGGEIGDKIKGILIKPATTSPGAVAIKDGGGTGDTVFAGGATSVADLAPIWVPYPATSEAGAWKVTTGSNVSVTIFGEF